MIPGHRFLKGKTRIRLLIPADHASKFSVPMNSQSAEEKYVYVWPAWIYDDPEQGTQGQIHLLIESLKKDKFAETFAHFFHRHPNRIQDDLIVERYKDAILGPSYFRIEAAKQTESVLPYDQSVVDELQGDLLKATVDAALAERERLYIEFFERASIPIHYSTLDVTFS